MSDRFCPLCGESWPLLTTHVCPAPPPDEPESLCALLWDVLTDIPVQLGDLDISTQVASVIAMPLAKQLLARADDLYVAVMSDQEALTP